LAFFGNNGLFETSFVINDQGQDLSAQETSDTMNTVSIATMQNILDAEVNLEKKPS